MLCSQGRNAGEAPTLYVLAPTWRCSAFPRLPSRRTAPLFVLPLQLGAAGRRICSHGVSRRSWQCLTHGAGDLPSPGCSWHSLIPWGSTQRAQTPEETPCPVARGHQPPSAKPLALFSRGLMAMEGPHCWWSPAQRAARAGRQREVSLTGGRRPLLRRASAARKGRRKRGGKTNLHHREDLLRFPSWGVITTIARDPCQSFTKKNYQEKYITFS